MAIGFVDLGGLAAACEMLTSRDEDLKAALAAAGDSVTAGSSSGSCSSSSSKPSAAAEAVAGREPLRYVGYEMSPYCVAKALVVLQMIEQGAALDNILQASDCIQYSTIDFNATLQALHVVIRQAVMSMSAAAGGNVLFCRQAIPQFQLAIWADQAVVECAISARSCQGADGRHVCSL